MAELASINVKALSRLNVEEREKVAELVGDMIVVQVYRELQNYNVQEPDGGCNIIGSCSNSSESELLEILSSIK